MSDNLTPFSNRCAILSDLWLNYRDAEEFLDFVEYNDIGLPLAYAVTTNAATATQFGEDLINETFDLLIEGLNIGDEGFESLDDIFEAAGPLE